jgi:hypothetical protein
MPILNYTTTVATNRTVDEITKRLVAHGVTHIMTKYDATRQPSGIDFVVTTNFGERMFRLPANISGVETVLKNEAKRRRIPPRLACKEQAQRVAWRILKNWIEVQLALIECGLSTVDEVLLPYLVTNKDQTLYQVMQERNLQLEAPKA